MRFRTRTLLVTGFLAVGLVAVAPLASAAEGPSLSPAQVKELTHEAETLAEANGTPKADAECIAKLIDGSTVAKCHEAPSPILPATDELVWGILSFLVLLFLMSKLAFPSIKKGMDARTERIRGDLDAAEHAKNEAAGVLDGYRTELAGAKAEAGRIIEEARTAADALKKDQAARLQDELAEIRSRAMADIESAKVQATADLRGEVAQLAVGAASVVVHKNLDAATQTQLIEDYINQVSSTR